jgi:Asp-tRNA(Asn)/Glu-tRNA(Gln) amidotransferase A subunit family amidase
VDAALEHCDVLVLPTLPIVAPVLGESEAVFEGEGGRRETFPVRAALLRLTQLFNVSGHPAISLPVPTSGMPVGIQLVGRRNDTEALLSVAMRCEHVLAA